eukprot:CAMPEP_0202721546 /NCGR_PEP_ID=MMETSP1385-20130828/149768_1 /ASSEMBLY_ACC=CAM_ASM_000861 /TAXON_ID=933848 /ORGANISM="Elphidium margaritaceum" /LENGTH=89 /DNA_ID=CAMNT_0049385799 /DNA_START=1 /DNA_END=267 /DNA_ORIENTATION=+
MQRMRQFVCSYERLSQSFDLKCKSEDVNKAMQSFVADLQCYRSEIAQYEKIDAQYRRLDHADEGGAIPATEHKQQQQQHEEAHEQMVDS